MKIGENKMENFYVVANSIDLAKIENYNYTINNLNNKRKES